MLNMVYPPLAILGTFVGVNLFNITSERTEKREITKTFGRYVSPSVVERILKALEQGELNLEGQQQEVTVVFADVRGYTGMSEKMQPEELVRVLNIYLSVVIKEVLRHKGMINKFGGDSVMAIWNVPTRCEGHALLATKAAVDAQRAIRELQQNDASLPKVDFGIGINTGKAVAGNLGSEDRLEYSVVGAVVNIAARLTSLAESGKVWIGSDTYDLIGDYCVAKPLGTLELRGKQEPIRAYEVVNIRQESVDLAC
jgi:adenylate cyclase